MHCELASHSLWERERGHYTPYTECKLILSVGFFLLSSLFFGAFPRAKSSAAAGATIQVVRVRVRELARVRARARVCVCWWLL